MRTIGIALCIIHKEISFSTPHIPSLMRDFFQYINSHAKEHKLYDKLLDKISPETELSVSDPSGKDGPALVPTSYTPVPPIQNNPPTCSSLLSLSYKSTSLSPTPGFKKPTVEIEENDDINSDVEIQSPSPQQPLQPALQTLQEDSK